MSLHTLANHLQSAGRGEDKVLVHMTPGEVNGLQSLAMAQGGSLTINPETGLPEAGFLKSLLPMIAGFALGPAGFGLFQTAMGAGLAVGAATGLATGSLKQGIMAGMGAYGGAGLGQGLMAQGAGAGAQGAAGVAGVADDVALANMQKGNVLGGINAQPQVFGQPVVSTTPGGMTGFNANVPPVTPNYAQTQANILESPMLRAAPPAPAAVTTQTSPVTSSAYSPSKFNAGQNLSGTGAGPRRVVELTEDKIVELPYTRPPAPVPAPKFPPGATGYSLDATSGKYTYYRPGAMPMDGGSGASSMGAPIESRIPTPVNPVVRSELLPGGPPVADPQSITGPFRGRMSQVGAGAKTSFSSMEGLKGLYNAMPTGSVIASGLTLAEAMKPEELKAQKDKSLVRPYDFDYGATDAGAGPYSGSAERTYFNPMFTARTPYEAPGPEYAAAGGLMGYAMGGPVENMSNMNAIGANTGYPMASLQTPMYSNPNMQQPEATNVIAPSADVGVGAYTGEQRFAAGGISDLGGYSDGGRLLRGPGDGVSDSIPAAIGNRQPARLADGEFVVPARIVSEIGNGSTEAGARKLYAMMERVQRARRKTVGKDQVARNTKAEKLLPA